jgi:glycosyltransferase involved in cell wall biosynthesis
MNILHAYKVSHAEIYGGIPEAIRILATAGRPAVTSRLLAARTLGLRRRFYFEGFSIQLTGSFGTMASTPVAPSYPFALAREAGSADVLALHVPFPLNDLGVWMGIPERTAMVVHWHAEVAGRRLLLQEAVNGLLRKTLARADRIVVSNEETLRSSDLLAPYLDKCAVVPFGVDTMFWGALGGDDRVEAEQLASLHPRLVLAVGRLVPYKGFDMLLEALTRIDASALIVGAGSQWGRLRRLAERRGLGERVVFTGAVPRERLRILLHAAKVFAFPSLTSAETFGIVQLEAMSAGLPIVNTSLPTGVPTVARHGLEALTVPPGDPAKLAEAIGQLLDAPDLAKNLGLAGRQRAVAEFDQRLFIDRMHELYAQSMVSRRSRARSSNGAVPKEGEFEIR